MLATAALVAVVLVLACPHDPEVVLNPSAAKNLSGWRGACDDGPLALRRVQVAGPDGGSTAVDVRHGPASRH